MAKGGLGAMILSKARAPDYGTPRGDANEEKKGGSRQQALDSAAKVASEALRNGDSSAVNKALGHWHTIAHMED